MGQWLAGFESRLVLDIPLPFIPTLIGLRAFDLVSSPVWWEAATNTFKKGDNINIKNYQLFDYIYDSGCRTFRGVSVLIRNDIPHSKVNIRTNIQAFSMKANLYKAVMNICSIYIPPSDDIDENEVKKKIVDQLPKSFILFGDFNCYCRVSWGGRIHWLLL